MCLAERGADGRSFVIRGTYDAARTYAAFDVVALNSSSFVALRDDPGQCPGEGWQALAMGGRRGERGQDGQRGPEGKPGKDGAPGVSIIAWEPDLRAYTATPIMSDGSLGPALDLRGYLEQFAAEAGL